MGVRIQPGHNEQGYPALSVRCPECRHNVSLDRLGNAKQGRTPDGRRLVRWGSQRCPRQTCGALILFVDEEDAPLRMYPAETIDFDTSNLPVAVLAPLEEAITCHAHGCYVAAAIMIRKTLEALCDDQGAEGRDLYKRLEALRGKVILPTEMFDGLHNIRLLGKDAAHVDAKIFEEVGKPQVEAAFKVAQALLLATYKYSELLGALEALKLAPDPG